MRPATIFCDIDGTILEHAGLVSDIQKKYQKICPAVLEKFNQWESQGFKIILTTGRPESMRSFTERQLSIRGLFWDQLIMGLGGGIRYLINDRKPDGTDTAFAINLDRDKGLGEANIQSGQMV